MSLPGVKATNLPLASSADSILVVRGGSARQLEPGLLSAQLGAVNGPSYETRAQLYADLAWPAGSVGKVLGDATLAYRGVYKKSGGSGSGSWTRIGPLPEADAEGLASEITAARQSAPTLADNLSTMKAATAVLSAASLGRLDNLFPNGNLDPSGAPLLWFSDLLGNNNSFGGDVVATDNPVFNALGITRALLIPANAEARGLVGNQLYVETRLKGGRYYCSTLVESLSGGWDMGSGITGPRVTLRYSDGTPTGTAFLAEYEDLGSNVRRYYGSIAAASGKIVTRVEVGLVVARPHVDAFRASGYWASHDQSAALAIQDTAYPEWRATTYHYPTALDTRLTALERLSTAAALKAALEDDFHSVNICLIGDSKVWGLGASGLSPSAPRTAHLDDPRNTIDASVSPTWANLLLRWLALTYCNGTITAGDPGVGYARKWAIGDICNDNARFQVRDRRTNGARPKSVTQRASGPLLLRNLDIPAVTSTIDDALVFNFTGDEFKIVFAKLNTDPGATFTVEIDGAIVGSTYAHGGGNSWNFSETITTTFGKHRVRIWNNSATQVLRLEDIRHHRRIQVRNQGIIGTQSQQWLPTDTTYALYAGIMDEDEFVLCQIGTNDRATTTSPLRINAGQRTRDNVTTIGNHLAGRGKKFIPMTPTRATNDYPGNPSYSFDTQELAMAIRQAAGDLGVSCIDNYAMSTFDPAGGYLSDGLHDNDNGHRGTFRNIVTSLGLVGLPLIS